MGAITEESSSKEKSKEDIPPFSFNYGPSLMLALISFVGCQLSGVASINYYITMRNQTLKCIKERKNQLNRKTDKENEVNETTKRSNQFPRKSVGHEKLKRSEMSHEGIYVNLAVDGSGELFIYDDSKEKYHKRKSDKYEQKEAESIRRIKQPPPITQIFKSPVINILRREANEKNIISDKTIKLSLGSMPLKHSTTAEATDNKVKGKEQSQYKHFQKQTNKEKILNCNNEINDIESIDTFRIIEDRYKKKRERKERRSYERRERRKERNQEAYGGVEDRFSNASEAYKSGNVHGHKSPLETIPKADLMSSGNGDINSILECPFSDQLESSPNQSEDTEEEKAMRGLSLLDLRRHQGLLLSCTSLGLLFSPYNQANRRSFTHTQLPESQHFETQQDFQEINFQRSAHTLVDSESVQQRPNSHFDQPTESLPVHRKFNRKKMKVYQKSSNEHNKTNILTDFESSPFGKKINIRKTNSSELGMTPRPIDCEGKSFRSDSVLRFNNSSFNKSSSTELAAFSMEDTSAFAYGDYLIKSKKKITHV